MAPGAVVRHLLLDADGVLQRVGGDGWRAEIRRRLGDRFDDFVRAVDEWEAPALRGRGPFPDGLDRVLAGQGVEVDVEELYTALWATITVDEQSVAVAGEARAAGLGVHLVTNQHARRATYMRDALGYDAHFDTCFYSCEVGAAKPDPEFFAFVLDRLGTDPGEVVLVDDSAANVGAARAAGMAAVRWHLDEGHAPLRSRLAAAGVMLAR